MKKRTLIILPCLLLIMASPAMGQQQLTQKVVVYYFNDESKTKDYRYYSYIIPDSISIELRKHENFEVQTIPVTMGYVDNYKTPELASDDISLLKKKGEEQNADYIVTGSYSVENLEIAIRSQVFNVNTGKIADVRSSREKIGALLFVIIDNISNEINSELQGQYAEHKSKIASSPFIGLYHGMKGLELGISYGRAYPMGKWKDVYNDTEIVDAFIGYNFSTAGGYTSFVKNLAAYLHFEFMSLNSEYMENTTMSWMNVYMPSLGIGYVHNFSEWFSVTGELAGGLAISQVKIPIGTDDGPLGPEYREESMDPYASLSIRGNITFTPVIFTGGLALKRIQFKDEAMNMTSMVFGVIYSIR